MTTLRNFQRYAPELKGYENRDVYDETGQLVPNSLYDIARQEGTTVSSLLMPPLQPANVGSVQEAMRRKAMMEDEDAMIRRQQLLDNQIYAAEQNYGQGAGQFAAQAANPMLNRNTSTPNPHSGMSKPGLLYDQPSELMDASRSMPAQPTRYEGPAGFAQQQMAEEQMLAQQQQDFQDREILAEYEAAEAGPSMSQSEIQGYGNVAMKALQGLQQNDQPPKLMKAPGLLQPNAAFLSSYRPPAQMRQVPRYNLLG